MKQTNELSGSGESRPAGITQGPLKPETERPQTPLQVNGDERPQSAQDEGMKAGLTHTQQGGFTTVSRRGSVRPVQPVSLLASINRQCEPEPSAALSILLAGGPHDGETSEVAPCTEIKHGEHSGADAIYFRYTRTLDRMGGRIVFAYAGEERVSTEPIGIRAVLRYLLPANRFYV